MRRPPLALALVLATLGSGVACRRVTPPTLRVEEVQVVDRTPGGARPPFDTAGLGRRAQAALGKAPGVAVGPAAGGAAGPRYRLRVELRQLDRAPPSVVVEGRLSPMGASAGTEGAPEFVEAGLVEPEDAAGRDGAPFPATRDMALGRAIDALSAGLGRRLGLVTTDARGLVAAIEGADPDLRDEAMRLAGERRERGALPVLLPLLRGADEEVRDRAIGALRAIGDEAAVRPLTELARFRDVEALPRIIEAVGAIGGQEARAYLEFVASGHEDPEIRELAKRSLGHLEARRAAPAVR